MKIVEYTIVSSDKDYKTKNHVDCLIDAGWQPLGACAVAMVVNPNTSNIERTYTQTMVKYDGVS